MKRCFRAHDRFSKTHYYSLFDNILLLDWIYFSFFFTRSILILNLNFKP